MRGRKAFSGFAAGAGLIPHMYGEGARITEGIPGLPSGPAEKHAPTKLRNYGTARIKRNARERAGTERAHESQGVRNGHGRGLPSRADTLARGGGGIPPPPRQGAPSGIAPFLRGPKNRVHTASPWTSPNSPQITPFAHVRARVPIRTSSAFQESILASIDWTSVDSPRAFTRHPPRPKRTLARRWSASVTPLPAARP